MSTSQIDQLLGSGTGRYRVNGQSDGENWRSVPTVAHLFRPLTEFGTASTMIESTRRSGTSRVNELQPTTGRPCEGRWCRICFLDMILWGNVYLEVVHDGRPPTHIHPLDVRIDIPAEG